MDRTVKEMATDINISLNRVYRYIKNKNIKPVNETSKTKIYNEDAQSLIYQHFTGNEDIHINSKRKQSENNANKNDDNENTQMVKLLEKELDNKNREIATLHKLLDQQQQLNLTNSKLLDHFNENKNDNNRNKDIGVIGKNEHTGNKKGGKKPSWWHLW